MAQKQTRLAERGIEPLKCTYGDCQKLQSEDGEFCDEHYSKTEKDKRICPNCKVEFKITVFTKSKIYCSEDCKRNFNRERSRKGRRKKYLNKTK